MGISALIWGTLCGGAALAVYLFSRQRKLHERFFAQLDALHAKRIEEGRVLSYAKHRIQARLIAPSRSARRVNRLSFILSLKVPEFGSFRLTKQNRAENIFERMGLEGAISVNDPAFDSTFHIASDDAAFASSYFSSAGKRTAAACLFEQGCTSIELDQNVLKVAWTPFHLKDDTNANFVVLCLPHLAALAEGIPQVDPLLPTGLTKKQFDIILGAACALPIFPCLPLFYAAGNFPLLDSWAMFLYSLRYSIPVLACFIFAAARWLKGKSWFASAWAQISSIALIYCLIYGYQTAIYLNGKLDTSQPATHTADVIDKTSHTRRRRSNTYDALLKSWRVGHHSEKLSIKGWEYRQIQPGQTTAAVVTKPGYFGYEWVVSYVFAPPVVTTQP